MKGATPTQNIVGHDEMHISRSDYDAHMRYVHRLEAEVERLRADLLRTIEQWEADSIILARIRDNKEHAL
jgi:hypothetical protein